jgi:hypothetical protein
MVDRGGTIILFNYTRLCGNTLCATDVCNACIRSVVAWAREVSSFNRRKASVFVQAVVWWSVSSMDVVGDDLGMGPRRNKEMAASPEAEEPLVKQTSLPNC